MIGTTLAHFRITEKLGAGGMGEVWRATDTKLERDVALKVLPEEFASDGQRFARFEREAKLLASINHGNIAHLYGLESAVPSGPEEDDGTPRPEIHFLAMELVVGEDLSERITRGPIPNDEAVPIALQIAEALEAAHDLGIVHRDLKPANIKLSEDGTVKVLDFGLAKAWETESSDSSLSMSPTMTRQDTVEGVILGTAAYMSPEQARGKRVDHRADIWAFGVVLWEMLTGERLFDGETVSDVMAAVLTHEPDLSSLPNTVPHRLTRVIERCLRRDLSRRYQSIGDVRVDLQDIQEQPAEQVDQVVQSLGPKWAPNSVSSLASWIIGAAIVGAVGFSFLRPTPDTHLTQIRATIPAPFETAFDIRTLAPGYATLSPDGSKAVFSAQGADLVTRLWVYELQTGSSRMLESTRSAQYPFWSPDSGRIAFFTQIDRTLKIIDADGGSPVTVCDAVFGKGGAWNSDGNIVFAPGYGTPLHVVSEEGGQSQEITTIDLEIHNSHRHPRFLPDGRRFLFMARSGDEEKSAVMIGSVDGDEPREIMLSKTQAEMTMDHLFFVRENSLIARPVDSKTLEFTGPAIVLAEGVIEDPGSAAALFSVSTSGLLTYYSGEPEAPTGMITYDRSGAIVDQSAERAWYQQPRVSPDGRHLAVSRSASLEADNDLWIGDLTSALWSRFTLDSSEDIYPVWMPDSRGVVFASNRSGPHALYKKAVDGAGLEEALWISHDALLPTDVTPDGRFVIFDQYTSGEGIDIWLFDQETGEARPLRQTDATETEASVSDDGRWMAYQSDETGRHEVYVTPFPGGGRSWQISQSGGMYPFWESGGSELVYLDLDGYLQAIPISLGGESLNVGRHEALFQIDPPSAGGCLYAPSPDFERFYISPSGVFEAENTLNLIVNWTAKKGQR